MFLKKIYLIIPFLCLSLLLNAQWNIQNSSTDTFLFDIYFHNQDLGWAVGMTNTIIHTENGGQDWVVQEVDPSSNYRSVFFIDENEGWAVGSLGKIVHTLNSGETWETLSANEYEILSEVVFVNSERGWIAGGDAAGYPGEDPERYILYTENGGDSWDYQFYESTETSWSLSGIFFLDENNGWAIGQNGYVLRTDNGGSNWDEISYETYSNLESVYFVNDSMGFICGQEGLILKTIDGGNNWEEIESNTTLNLTDVEFVDQNTGWICGGANEEAIILKTENGGSTWIAEDIPTQNYLSAISFVSNELGWAAGFEGTVIHRNDGGSFTEQVNSNISLKQNYPNPFNPETKLTYRVDEPTNVRLSIFNFKGRLVKKLVDKFQTSGEYTEIWNGTDYNGNEVSSGIYFYTLAAEQDLITKKAVLIK